MAIELKFRLMFKEDESVFNLLFVLFFIDDNFIQKMS